jgi:hypothetical protein
LSNDAGIEAGAPTRAAIAMALVIDEPVLCRLAFIHLADRFCGL